MKIWKRAASVGLSLALCAGMVMPGMAASFSDLQNAINGEAGTEIVEGSGRYGYGSQKEDSSWEIEAWDSEDGRNVKLNEDVKYSENDDPSKNKVITIGDINAKNPLDVTLDLNGQSIDGTGSGEVVINVNKQSSLTIEDTSADASGKVTGGSQGGIKVNGNSDLTLKSGNITGNTNKSDGGGVVVNGSFVMDGGSITNNSSNYRGGGVMANGHFEMNGGSITQNHSNSVGGGGVFVAGSFEMKDGDIAQNTTIKSGAGVYVQGEFDLLGGKIAENTADSRGGGVHVATSGAEFTMSGGEISKNTAVYGGGVSIVNSTSKDGKNATFTMNDGSIEGNEASLGSGVYMDTNTRSDAAELKMNGGKLSGETVFGETSTFITDTNIYEFVYTLGEKIIGSDGKETTLRIVTITVKDTDGKVLDSVTTTPLLKDDAHFAVDASALRIELAESMIDTTTTATAGNGGYVDSMGFHPYPASPAPGGDITIEDPAETEIDEPAVPLASGPVTRAEFIDYLWRHEGEPESDGVCTFTDVPADHEYVLALAWAEQNGVAEAYLNAEGHEDGTFEPDELVTVGAAREFLGNFARVFGMDVDVYALVSLTGNEDEAVLNCGEVIAEFFGEEYVESEAA